MWGNKTVLSLWTALKSMERQKQAFPYVSCKNKNVKTLLEQAVKLVQSAL